MIRMEIRGDFGRSMLAGIRRDLHPQVIQPALNKVAAKAIAEINRAIPEEYAVKAAEVRNAITLRQARSGVLEAVIQIFGSASRRGRSANMARFLAAYQALGRAVKTRGSKAKRADLKLLGQHIGFQVRRVGGIKKIEGAFVGNKGRTVFRRTGKGRLPIEPLQVIGFAQMFTSTKISRRVMDKVRAEIPVEIDRAIQRLLARAAQ